MTTSNKPKQWRAKSRLILAAALVALAALGVTGTVLATANTSASTPATAALKTDPVDGATLTAPARSLRVWLDHTPVVEKSSLTLEGPKGEMTVEGLHTMGADDLMARVIGPMPNGSYTGSWSSVATDGTKSNGSWTFTIQRGQ